VIVYCCGGWKRTTVDRSFAIVNTGWCAGIGEGFKASQARTVEGRSWLTEMWMTAQSAHSVIMGEESVALSLNHVKVLT
jgi:hypothetical protein